MTRLNSEQFHQSDNLQRVTERVHQSAAHIAQVYNFGKRDFLWLEEATSPPSEGNAVEPFIAKPQEGMITYYANQIFLFTGGLWTWIPSARWVADNFAVAQYAQISKDPALWTIDDIPALVAPCDDISVPARGITINLANGSVAFQFEGVYQFSVLFAMSVASVNRGRVADLEVFDITSSTVLTSFPVSVPRDSDVLNAMFTSLVDIPAAGVGNEVGIRFSQAGGGSDDFIGTIDFYTLGVHMVSEWRSTLPGEPGFTGGAQVGELINA